jgi:ribose 5-phosphate isomerase B
MTLSVALGADHGGFALKEDLLPWLQAQGYEVMDVGAKIIDPEDDYPDYSEAVAAEVAAGRAT